MIKKILFLWSFIIYSSFLMANENIVMMTENYPPYNMEYNGKLSGISVDIVAEILKEINSNQTINDIKMTTWSRAYSYAQKENNHMVFSTTLTTQRKKLFKWVGPIAPTTIAIFAKKSRKIKINSIEDLNKYKIGTVLKDIGEQLLQKNGVNSHNIYSVSSKNAIKISFNKLRRDRIDLFAYAYEVAQYGAMINGFDTSKYEVVYILKKGELFFAFNKQTDDKIIKKWQKAIDKIKKDRRYKKVITKYLGSKKEQKIKLLTEEMSPWQIKDGNKLTGSSVEIIREIQKRVNNKNKITIFPWNRGYNVTLKNNGYALFSTVRTKQREKLFKWVGPLLQYGNSIYKHIDNKKVYKTLDDAKKAKSIVVTNNDVQEQYLSKHGFKNLQIRFGKSAFSNIEYILSKKAELMPIATAVGDYNIKRLGLKDKIVKTKIKPYLSKGLFIAFNINTPDYIINKWQKALDDIKDDGIYTKIMNKYK